MVGIVKRRMVTLTRKSADCRIGIFERPYLTPMAVVQEMPTAGMTAAILRRPDSCNRAIR